MLLLIVQRLLVDLLYLLLQLVHLPPDISQLVLDAGLEVLGHHFDVFLLLFLQGIRVLKQLFALQFPREPLDLLLVFFYAVSQIPIFSKHV